MEDQRLVKTVMLGMVEGDRPRGRPKKMVWRYCRLMWMCSPRGGTTGQRQTRVETNHWPQRPTRVMSSEEVLLIIAVAAYVVVKASVHLHACAVWMSVHCIETVAPWYCTVH